MAGEIFISYRRADAAWARRLHELLRAEGVEAWYDAHVGAGEDWRVATAQALQDSRIFVLLFSSNAAQSSDIAKELAAAVLEKKLIVPVRLENIAPKGAFLYELASRNWINAYEDTDAKFAELARGLAKLVTEGVKDESALPFDRATAHVASQLARRSLIVVFTGLLILAAAATTYRMFPHLRDPHPASAATTVVVRVAVLPFDVLRDDAALREFSGGLQAEMVGQLSQNQVPVVTDQGGAVAAKHVAYVFSGTIEHMGKQLLVRVHLDDARQSVPVWAAEFTGDDNDPRALQKQISTQASLVSAAAVREDKLANGDTEAMTLLIKSDQYSLSIKPEDKEGTWEVAKKLAAKFPDNGGLQYQYAIAAASLAIGSTPERAAELRKEAKTVSQYSLAHNPPDTGGYFVQSFLFPSVGHWTERENLLLQGLHITPQNALLTNIESNFLREVGRLKDGVTYGRQAQAPTPSSANRDATLILALAVTGNSFEAGPLADTAALSWPAHPGVWNARFELALFQSRWDTALALLKPGGYVPIPESVAGAWRSALEAMKFGDPGLKRDAVRQLIGQLRPAALWPATPPAEVMTPGGAIGMLAILGDKEAAFAQAKAYLNRDSYADSSFLFWPNLAAFRRDPRFMVLATEIGLVDYWRTSGKWPDFCSEPGLPYDCRREAIGAAH